MIALARGLLLKPSGKMKWIANVDVHAAEAEDTDCFSLFPIEADDEYQAARTAAGVVARALYGPSGEVSWSFDSREKDGGWIMNVGVYQGRGVTRGGSVTVKVDEYRGA